MRHFAVAMLVELPDDSDEIGQIVVWHKIGGYPLPVRLLDIHPDPSAVFSAEQLAPFTGPAVKCQHCGREIEPFGDDEWKDAGSPDVARVVRCYDEADTIPTDIPSDQRHEPAS